MSQITVITITILGMSQITVSGEVAFASASVAKVFRFFKRAFSCKVPLESTVVTKVWWGYDNFGGFVHFFKITFTRTFFEITFTSNSTFFKITFTSSSIFFKLFQITFIINQVAFIFNMFTFVFHNFNIFPGHWGEDQMFWGRDALQAGGERSRGVLREKGAPEKLFFRRFNFTFENMNVFPYPFGQGGGRAWGGGLRGKGYLQGKGTFRGGGLRRKGRLQALNTGLSSLAKGTILGRRQRVRSQGSLVQHRAPIGLTLP